MKVMKIGFVGIPVTDIERARGFYEGVLGLKVSEEMMGGKWIEYGVGDGYACDCECWRTMDTVGSRHRRRPGDGGFRRGDRAI